MTPIETLTCKEGHTWTRPPTRGKKPAWCPEHRPQPVKSESPLSKDEALERARQAKQENQQKARTSIDQQVQDILASNRNPELKRKLAYAHEHISHPGMADVRRDLLREATKR